MGSAARLYDYVVDPASANTAGAFVLRFTGAGLDVLEIGAGPGAVARQLVERGGHRVTAVEYDAECVGILGGFCELAVQGDLNDDSWPAALGEKKFDAIVAADVLEHLYDPWAALRLASTLLKEGGSMIVSLPHSGHAAIMACLMEGDFRYRGLGLLDRTHIRFFGMRNVQALFAEAGLRIEEYGFVLKRPEETEFADIWARLAPAAQAVLAAADFAYVYQVVVRAMRAPGGDGVNLLECASHLTSAGHAPAPSAARPVRVRLGEVGHRALQKFPAAHRLGRLLYRALLKPV